MGRLTEHDGQGNWQLKGLYWKNIYEGAVITKNVNEKIYGALCKLKDYEDTGLTPDQIGEIQQYREVKKAHTWGDGYDDDGNLIYDMYDCPNCGQHIDWSVDHE